jgi:hypothetical protein
MVVWGDLRTVVEVMGWIFATRHEMFGLSRRARGRKGRGMRFGTFFAGALAMERVAV